MKATNKLALLSLLCLPLVTIAGIDTYYVSKSGNDANDGKSWANAFATPNKGFDVINESTNRGSHLWIDSGEYALTKAIGVNGGSNESKRSFVRSKTGNPKDVVLYSDGTFECLRMGSYIQISGITFSNGVNRAGCPSGGIRFAGAKPVNAGEHPGIVSNCIVTCCQNIYGSGTNGAAVAMYYNDLLIDSVIRNNTAPNWCGAGVLMVDYANGNRITGGPTMKRCRVEGNSAKSNGAGVFVACYQGATPNAFSETEINIEDCEITGNSAANGAGVFCMTNMTITMTGCAVSNNTASANSTGIRLESGCNLSMRDCIVSENSGGSGVGVDVIAKTASKITTLSCSNTVFRGNAATSSGGGIRVYGAGRAFLDDCIVEGNSSDGTGGGVDVVSSGTLVPVITCSNTVIRGNSAETSGGGVHVYGSGRAFLDDCIVEGNSSGGTGGGADVAPTGTYVPELFCSATVFRDNVASTSGGAVRIRQFGRASFDGCRFDGNSVTSTSQQNDYGGGAIFMTDQNAATNAFCSVSNCVFACNSSNNRAGAMGGTWNNLYFSGAIVNCIFTNNLSRLQGGALVIRDSANANPNPPIIRNCLFAFNSTTNLTTDTNGGAVMFAAYSNITLENCTIVSNNICNTAGYKSGGIHHRYTGKLKNCIVAFNTVCGEREDANYWNNTSTLSADNFINCCSDLSNNKFGSSCVIGDPKFVDPANGDFRIQPNVSPCINAGVNADWMAGKKSKDLAGVPRIYDEIVDIGCYEVWFPKGTVLSVH